MYFASKLMEENEAIFKIWFNFWIASKGKNLKYLNIVLECFDAELGYNNEPFHSRALSELRFFLTLSILVHHLANSFWVI